MKILYFDCFSGVSGDMILGALVDAGLDLQMLKKELGKLQISDYAIEARTTEKNKIRGTKFDVRVQEGHVHRTFKDICEIVNRSALNKEVKEKSLEIFKSLARAEAGIHSTTIDRVHFHEVGAVDAIIDVVGAVIGIQMLAIDEIRSSPIHVGTGFVKCQHGEIPVPAPATLELLKGIPVFSHGIKSELATPTGVAILRTLVKTFGEMPAMKIEQIGYGAGSRDLTIPNLLRICIGTVANAPYEQDEVMLLESNIDNMSPELLAYACEQLLKQGVLDVFTTPIMMKKNRAGTLLSVITTRDQVDDALATIFSEVSTLGVRISHHNRKKLARKIIRVSTEFGELSVKIGMANGSIKSIQPEYEECRELASAHNQPISRIHESAREAARKFLSADTGN